MINENKVAVWRDYHQTYSEAPPFDPSEYYPEFPDLPPCGVDNPAFRGVRSALNLLGLDRENFRTPIWNPLAKVIKPADTVVLKPNFVTHRNHGEKLYGISDTDCLITHGSVIRAVLEYAAKAMKGVGKIIIGDCPIQGADWKRIIEITSLDQVIEVIKGRHPGLEVQVKDYRLAVAITKHGRVVERVASTQSMADYTEIDLGADSLLVPLVRPGVEFGVTQYPRQRMKAAHTKETNKYLIPNDFLYADVVINLPKMKNHMKAGITCALKNLVGINGHKDYLPHFRFGSPKSGGDEYPDGGILWDLMWKMAHKEWDLDKGLRKRAYYFISRLLHRLQVYLYGQPLNFDSVGGGGWFGNDTLWRTILDINRCFFYFSRQANMVEDYPSKDVRYLAILDGIVAGEGQSPLAPTPKPVGLVMASINPVAMDTVATTMMGFDYRKIKQIAEAYEIKSRPLVGFRPWQIKINSNFGAENLNNIIVNSTTACFRPSRGFASFIELKSLLE